MSSVAEAAVFKFKYAAPINKRFIGDRFRKSLIEVCGKVEFEGEDKAIEFINDHLPEYLGEFTERFVNFVVNYDRPRQWKFGDFKYKENKEKDLQKSRRPGNEEDAFAKEVVPRFKNLVKYCDEKV